ncbi:MAG: hypothetical protein AB2629_08465, partial [Candidatus Thiodiazotropha sp.]
MTKSELIRGSIDLTVIKTFCSYLRSFADNFISRISNESSNYPSRQRRFPMSEPTQILPKAKKSVALSGTAA